MGVADGGLGPGLTNAEARARLAAAGPNRLVGQRPWARVRAGLRMLVDPMALMLGTAATVYLLIGQSRDGVILLVSLIPVLGVDVLLQARSRAALARLAERVATPALVIREGREQHVRAEEVVQGDLLVLREGSVAHADGVLLAAANLAMDEAPLTGESLPQEKRATSGPDDAERKFFAGTLVLAGQGVGLVEATGAATRYGRIGRLTADAGYSSTPLQRKIARAVRGLAIGAVVCAFAVAALARARGATFAEAFVTGISFAIAAVPEEFPLVFTLFLSIGAWRLAQHGVMARRLASVEALGSTTVICVDKTGTITLGRFSLTDHVPVDPGTTDDALLEVSVLACERTPQDPLERAIVEHAAEHGCDVAALHARWDLVRDHDFDTTGRHMTHAWRAADGAEWIVAKGAFEGIVEHCSITPETRAAAERAHAALASGGARVLAVAGKRVSPGQAESRREDDERGLTLHGFLGFEDPVRPEVAAAVAECRSAGIQVVLVTGDHALTARAVAHAAGIAGEGSTVLTGFQLDRIPPGDLVTALRSVRVLARVRPEQKSLVVDSLRRSGEVVAMTGDGINDAPALRRADIGVSMGPGATEVAREAAGLVLLENDFRGLVTAVREGRAIFLNLQRAFLYLVSFHVPVIALSFVPLVAGLPPLLLPIHLVWLELVVHPVSALAFEGEPAPPDVMRRPPRNPRSPMLGAGALLRTVATGAVVSAVALLRYAGSLEEGIAHARSAALAVVMLSSVLLVWAERAITAPWWSLPWPRRRRFWIVLALVTGSLPLLSALPASAAALAIVPLDAGEWVLSGVLAVLAVGWRVPGTRASRRHAASAGAPSSSRRQ